VDKVGNGLRKSAETTDNIVEAVESTTGKYILGIQWHPELEDGESSAKIFRSFIEKCMGS